MAFLIRLRARREGREGESIRDEIWAFVFEKDKIKVLNIG